MATLTNYVNGLTEDTTPVVADDYVMTYDASASALKKVKLHRLLRQRIRTRHIIHPPPIERCP